MQLAEVQYKKFTDFSRFVTLKAPVKATVYHVMIIDKFSLHSFSHPDIVCLQLDDRQHDSICFKPVPSLLVVLAHWLVGGWLVHAVPML